MWCKINSWRRLKLVWIQSLVFFNPSKESRLSCCLPIVRRRKDGFMPFPKGLAQNEMRTTSSSIWNRAAYSISYDDDLDAERISTSLVSYLGQSFFGFFFLPSHQWIQSTVIKTLWQGVILTGGTIYLSVYDISVLQMFQYLYSSFIPSRYICLSLRSFYHRSQPIGRSDSLFG